MFFIFRRISIRIWYSSVLALALVAFVSSEIQRMETNDEFFGPFKFN